ncbi:glycosyltransferase family 4 protein [Sulfobacillus thermosulfidooxidans]|uniref:glycosyltransferase family 4 protein n=1 Tax=Sulfobacillus thermosulfidooxidans TaxID=28034 RepID=UPI0006B6982C|nr:glycosyltransferase family 4 protein [Sulfobacillus thermosulfidooxidans]
MRIAIIADAGSVHTRRWVWGLKQHGHDIRIWSERAWDDFDHGVVHLLPKALRFRRDVPVAVWQLRREIPQFSPDIIHAHYISHYGLLAALARLSPPLVMSIWGADIECFPKRHGLLSRRLTQWILGQADAITCSSHYLKTISARYTKKPLRVIPFGIDLQRFRPHPPNQGPVRFIINKALEPVYGIDLILTALKDVQGDYVVRILGEGSQRQTLLSLAKTYHLEDRIIWVGKVGLDELPDVLAWGDVGLYPSRRESFGVAPLEMMALGRAVVAHRLGGLTEVINDNVTGFLVEPDNIQAWQQILQQIVDDPSRIRQMGEQGPGWVASRYNFDENLTSMIALYEQLRLTKISQKRKTKI